MSFDPWTSMIGVAGTMLGVGVTLSYQRYASAEKIVPTVLGVELSSDLMSNVDLMTLPPEISDKFRSLRPWMSSDLELKENSDVITVGSCQKALVYIDGLKELFQKSRLVLDACQRSLDSNTFSSADSESIFLDSRLNGLLMGMTSRGELPAIKLPEKIPDALVNYYEGVISTEKRKIEGIFVYPKNGNVWYGIYNTEHDKELLSPAVKAICHGISEPVRVLLSAMKDNIEEAKSNAYDVAAWIEKNIHKHATIIINLSVTNLGVMPVLLDNTAELSIKIEDSKKVSVPCVSEDFNNDSANEKSTNMIVRAHQEISEKLGLAFDLRNRVPLDRVLVAGGETISATYRSCQPIGRLPQGDKIIKCYEVGENRASFRMGYTNKKDKNIIRNVEKVFFGSNIEMAVKTANKALHSD